MGECNDKPGGPIVAARISRSLQTPRNLPALHDMLFLLELIDGMLAVDDLVLRFGRPGGHSQGRLLRVVLRRAK